MSIRLSRRLAMTTLALGLAAQLAGCASTQSGQAAAPAPAATVIEQSADLRTLSQLIKQAGLTEALNGAGPVTVFAPTDDAFKALPAAQLDKLARDPVALKALLQQHVVSGETKAASLQAGNSTLNTTAGGKLPVSKAGDFVTVEDAVVTQADVPASNGVIHVIDRVLSAPPAKK